VGHGELPVCEAWYEAEQVGDHLVRISEPHAGPLINANIWLVLGTEADLLVDTGNGLAPLRPFVERLRSDPEKPLIVVATHGHMDHVCGLHEFDERLLHAADAREAAAPDRLLFDDDVWPAARRQMVDAGYPIPALGIQAAPRRGFDPAAFRPTGASATRLVEEGDLVELGDRNFRVLHLPGHTPGSIGLWDEAVGMLFSGDVVYDDALVDTAPTSDIPAYLATMRRVRELPVEVVHAGHGVSFGRDVLAARCDGYLAARGGDA
jgi:glyoxylase-like metal-dependent hydrolase (beta-lactamase superfamily II)